jgi:hypothetical protein
MLAPKPPISTVEEARRERERLQEANRWAIEVMERVTAGRESATGPGHTSAALVAGSSAPAPVTR